MTSSTQPRSRLRQQVRAAFAGTALVVAAPGAFAATITVNSMGDAADSTDCTLRNAIIAANSDAVAGSCTAGAGPDMIVFNDSVSSITLAGTALPTIMSGSTLTIGMAEAEDDDEDATGVTIDANQMSRIFTNQGDLTLNGLTLINGSAITSGGDADARSGGAILNDDGGVLTVNGGAMNNNTADRAGGAIEEASGVASDDGDDNDASDNVRVTLNDVDFSGNDAGANPGNGGALHVTGSGDILVNGGTFDGNTATEGGALWNNAGTMSVDGATFTANTATGPAADEGGAAIFGENTGGTILVTGAMFANNTAGTDEDMSLTSGGAILLRAGGTLNVSDSVLMNNSANRAGGAIEVLGGTTTTLDNVTATGNNAGMNPGNGGVVHVSGDGNVDVVGGVYANNTAVEGGAFWNNQGEMSFDGVSIVGNEATGADASQGGGAIYAETNDAGADSGTLTIANSRISGNSASGTAGSGGGILVSPGATADITDSRIFANTSNRAGGGIESASGIVSLTRVTLGGTASGAANNAGMTPGNGGGLHVGGTGTTTIVDSTVGYNMAVEGGGLWNNTGSTMTLDTSTVSNNTATRGAGVYLNGNASAITLNFASITNNDGIGIESGSATTGVVNVMGASLVANNDTDIGDNITVDDMEAVLTGSVDVDTYRLFGGTTATQPLVAGSTALDTNDCGSTDTDQRGATRPFDVMDTDNGGDCDSGAFELTDDPVVTVTSTSPDMVTANDDEDTSVIGFTLANNSADAATVAGFSGYIDRGTAMGEDGALPAGFDLSGAELNVYVDANANGMFDSGETLAGTGEVGDNGSSFTVTFNNGGASIPANDDMSYVVTANLSDDDTVTTVSVGSLMPIYAGGALLGLVGLLSVGGVRRRTQMVLIVASVAVMLTACSDDDNVDVGADNGDMGNGGMDGGDNGDPMTMGQVQFIVHQLNAAAGDDLVIGDNLPISGSIVTFEVDTDDTSTSN